jgi:YbbR domain-containing protein
VKTVPLQVKLVGKMPQGYSIEKLKPNVEQVTVYGPQSYLDQLEFYNGLEIDLSKLELTQSQKITLAIPIQGETEKVEPALVEYEVTVVPSSTRTFTNVPITFIGVNDDYSTKVIDPAPGDIDVIVEGAPSVLNNLKPQDVQVIVDVSDLPPGVHSLQVSLNLPSLLQASNRFTKTVQVEIKAKDVSSDGSIPAVTEEHTGNDGMGQQEPSPDGSSDGDKPVLDVPAVPEGSNAGGNASGT